MTSFTRDSTCYDTLNLHPTASQAEIKAAYHRLLLTTHPDKQKNSGKVDKGLANRFDLDRIRDAYRTLSDPETRLVYDTALKRGSSNTGTKTGPRPAQIVSLEEFETSFTDGRGANSSFWTYSCRCGGQYAITEADLENDLHLIACERCSETIYVGYEAVEDDGIDPMHDG